MIEIEIGPNDADQRLDRFLRKYLRGASLSRIYRMIRKDVKVNGLRAGNETVLRRGDRLSLYLKEEELKQYRPESIRGRTGIRKSFSIAYEDENILAAVKPQGLLTHGDSREKKNTLVNQVTDYLIEKGEYVPRIEKSFSPAAVNRLDRNTTGLVLFGKNGMALRMLNRMIKDKDAVGKYYLTVLCGALKERRILSGNLEKDEKKNRVAISELGRAVETRVRPLAYSADGRYTFAEVRLMTGRTHQIRAHLASAGYPVAGDGKYGDLHANREIAEKYGLTSQLLHAYRLRFFRGEGELAYLTEKEIRADLPGRYRKVVSSLFGEIGEMDLSGEDSLL